MLQTLSWLPRTEGAARLRFARRDEQTQLDVLYQAGAARVRFPRPAVGAPPEAVLLNTAGGLTGGDRMNLDVTLGARAEATLTTAAAEKIYRARDGDATIGVKLALGAGARLAWLPQATILFDGSRLDRRTDVQLAGDARFLGVEFLIFGRQAMGEDVHLGACRDAWRIRRDGALVFADTFRVRRRHCRRAGPAGHARWRARLGHAHLCRGRRGFSSRGRARHAGGGGKRGGGKRVERPAGRARVRP